MRVLHLTSGNLFGGVETILVTLARLRHLCPAMEPHFGVCFEGRLSETLRSHGAAVHFLGNVRVSRPWTVVQAREQLRALLERISFDAVVAHMAWPHAVFAPVVKQQQRALLFYLHNRVEGNHWSERWARRHRPDLTIAVSQDTATTANRLFDSPVVVSYSPIPRSDIHIGEQQRTGLRKSLDTPDDAVVIVQVSRLEEWKGHRRLLAALGRLRTEKHWVCWIAGGAQKPDEHRYLRELQALTVHHGVSNRVRFLGERRDVADLLGSADIYCQANTATEGFSIVFMEAFLASLPIVTTGIGGALELIDDNCGRLLPMNDSAALEQALEEFINDAVYRTQCGQAGNRRVHELCDPAAQMEKLRQSCERAGALRRGAAAEVRA